MHELVGLEGYVTDLGVLDRTGCRFPPHVRPYTVFTYNLRLVSRAREMVDEDIGYTKLVDLIDKELELFIAWTQARKDLHRQAESIIRQRLAAEGGRTVWSVFHAWQGWLAAKGLA